MARRQQASRYRRIREHSYMLAAVYEVQCYVCGEQIEPDRFLLGDYRDGVLWHHIDMNRANNDPSNMALCHRDCHRSFHRQYEEHGKDIRTDEAIEHWGETPKGVKSTKLRIGGALK